MKKTFFTFLLLVVLLSNNTAYSQSEGGRAAFGAIFNGTKYYGELTDNQIWIGGEGFFRWNIFSYLSLNATFGFNQYRMKTDAAAIEDYPGYFDKYYPLLDPNDPNDLARKGLPDFYLNRVITGDLTASINLIPSQAVVPYFFGGIGFMNNSPLKGKTGADGGTPNISVSGQEDTKNSISFPVGFGLEFYLTDNLILNFKGTYRFINTDYFDDIPDESAGDGWGWNNAEHQPNIGKRQLLEGMDKLITFGAGFSYYIFGEADTDGDGLSNYMEKIWGTDPSNPDTDGDGLTDYEEVMLYKTNPLKADSDEDGLTDKEEVFAIYGVKTNPNLADTDSDGLSDYEELVKYKTDPLNFDTDGDKLSDGDEVNKYKTDPLKPDSDGDGLNDYDEVFKYKTNPLNPDTDGDGLNDYDEIEIHKTDPLLKDTDGDGLTDGDEVNRYKTNPNMVDSDNDGLSDGDEINRYKTDPTKADTDGDGLNDGNEVNVYKTNPLSKDTDNDGADDRAEIEVLKTNPLNPDTDGDGVLDGEDDCPLVKGVPSKEKGMNGCPKAPPPPPVPVVKEELPSEPVKIGTKIDFPDINFRVGKDEFDFANSNTVLNLAKLLQYVNQCDNIQVEIEGHTSSEGNAAKNQTLSERRAQKVVMWLISQGVPPSKIAGAVGYGSSMQKVQEPTAQAAKKMKKSELEEIRKQNRRISVMVKRTCD